MCTLLALALVSLAPIETPEVRVLAVDQNEHQAIVQLGAPRHIPTALDSVRHPWPGVALSLSAIGAALPVALAARPHQHLNQREYFFGFLSAEIVTPAAGYLYAGLGRRALIGMTTRAVGFGIAAAAGYNSWGSADFTGGDMAMLFGATMIGVSAVWDVMMVPGDVQKRNDAWLDEHAALELRLLPDGRAPALALTMRF